MFSLIRQTYSILLLSLLTLGTVGCGDSQDAVFANQPGSGSSTQTELVFRFEKPVAAQTVVPADTTSIRFDLYSSATASSSTLLSTETRLYADLIVLQDVSPQTRLVKVSLLGPGGIPTGTYSALVEVAAGSRTEVTLRRDDFVPSSLTELAINPNPVDIYVSLTDESSKAVQLAAIATIDGIEYDLPFEQVTLSAQDPGVLTVFETGTVVADTNLYLWLIQEEEGLQSRLKTTLTASTSLNGSTRDVSVPVRLHHFFSMAGLTFQLFGLSELPVSQGEEFDFDLEEGNEGLGAFIYLSPDGEFVPVPTDELTAEFASTSDKITYDPVSKVLTVAPDAPLGAKFSMAWTWHDDRPGGTNHTFVERLNFVVDEDTPI